MRLMKKRTAAFSLVELVIVIVIIGVIAAIAVPRIGRGAKGAADSALRANLATLRNAIDLYAVEHGGKYPASTTATSAAFENELTQKTDVSGNVGTTANVHIYGPYLRQLPPLPVGAKKGQTAVDVQATGPASAAGDFGWVYNNTTGDIKANTTDAEVDDSNIKYNTY
jgi:prepilin-type N-terminal cleavage/methylation domain-containing protein